MGFGVPAPVSPQPTRHGFQYVRLLGPRCDHLHRVGTARARVGNRPWCDDQDATLLLVDFFHPPVPSLRGLQPTTTWAQGPTQLGMRRTSLGARSAAASVCDAALLPQGLATRSPHLRPSRVGADQATLAALTAVAGSLWPALPRMRWAVWQAEQPRAAKRPGVFAGFRQGPVGVPGTAGTAAERAEWRRLVQPGGCDVCDRGDGAYDGRSCMPSPVASWGA